MGGYGDFYALANAADSDLRARAAHMAAQAWAHEAGDDDERVALYAALIGFLDDPSVKVRAALAHGLLHVEKAPRPVISALLQDAPVVARALAQYSPAVLDTDLVNLARDGDMAMLKAIAARGTLGRRALDAVLERGERASTVALLARDDLMFGPDQLAALAARWGKDAHLRGVLLARSDLPAATRMELVEAAAAALAKTRIVCGAVAPARLERVLRAALDEATCRVGETAAEAPETFVAPLVAGEKIQPRLLLHALIEGQTAFFSAAISHLSGMPRARVGALVNSGPRAALQAMFGRAGIAGQVGVVMTQIVLLARSVDLSDEAAARHFIVTAMIEDLVACHGGDIPAELDTIFAYLSERNSALGRRAARGVLSGFTEIASDRTFPDLAPANEMLALPAA